MKGLRKVQDGVNPVPEAPHTLHFVQHGAIAEDELFHFRIGAGQRKKKTTTSVFISCYLRVPALPYTKLHIPIRQAEDEEFNKSRFQQQLLVFWAEVAETRDALCPLSDDLHGGREQLVKLFDVVGVFFLARADFRLIILKYSEGLKKCSKRKSSNARMMLMKFYQIIDEMMRCV